MQRAVAAAWRRIGNTCRRARTTRFKNPEGCAWNDYSEWVLLSRNHQRLLLLIYQEMCAQFLQLSPSADQIHFKDKFHCPLVRNSSCSQSQGFDLLTFEFSGK